MLKSFMGLRKRLAKLKKKMDLLNKDTIMVSIPEPQKAREWGCN